MPGSVTLLVVEDEPIIGMMMQDVLEDGGFAVVLASNGFEALTLLEERKDFGGLITDIQLGPGHDGWQLARCARAINGRIAVVYVTGDSAGKWEVEGVSGSLVLPKPFTDLELVTAIRSLVD